MMTLMSSTLKNERFILVAENWSYQKMTQYVAHKLGRKIPRKILRSSYLKTAWLFESLASGLGLKKKFLTKALIKSLGDQTTLDGTRVTKRLHFSYQKIAPYMDSIFENH